MVASAARPTKSRAIWVMCFVARHLCAELPQLKARDLLHEPVLEANQRPSRAQVPLEDPVLPLHGHRGHEETVHPQLQWEVQRVVVLRPHQVGAVRLLEESAATAPRAGGRKHTAGLCGVGAASATRGRIGSCTASATRAMYIIV